ncbi:MAG: 2'-5' RNA ligase family protein [Candidatus Limnocylindrales bacterium]
MKGERAGRVTGERSALVVPIQLPAHAGRLRARHDPVALLGVPAHMTLLFPFAGAAALDGLRPALASLVAQHPVIRCWLNATARFKPDSLYLVPRPDDAVRALIASLSAAYPAYPPYAGSFPDVVPHVTVAGQVDPAEMPSLEAAFAAQLPIEVVAGHVSVLVERGAGRWRTRWRLRLGTA